MITIQEKFFDGIGEGGGVVKVITRTASAVNTEKETRSREVMPNLFINQASFRRLKDWRALFRVELLWWAKTCMDPSKNPGRG